MFHSIRTKLLASYTLVILLCLTLAGLGTVLLVNRYQREATLSRHRTAATAMTAQVRGLLALRVGLDQITAAVVREVERLGMRALLVQSDGAVLVDTQEESKLEGLTLRFPGDDVASLQGRRYEGPDGQRFVLIVSALQPGAARPPSDSAATHLVLAVPETDLRPAWRELSQPVLAAGLLALLASAVISLLLSRSIAKPLVAMTRASAKIAKGDYQEKIAVAGQDEVARLADSFNSMAREVERSRQSQRDFLANVSHDLKTPLTSIQGFSQAMLEGAIHDDTGYQRAATIINEEASRMSTLIANLLKLAQLESGTAIGDRILVSPSELASHATDRMRLAATEAGLTISPSLPETVPLVSVDRDQLEQAICNLLDNAIHHTLANGTIETAVVTFLVHRGRTSFTTPPVCPLANPGDGHWVAIQIRDTGCGIAAKDLPHIFERFYRVDKARSGSGRAGLGLAIAKGIVEAHGGAIQVQSEPDMGSCFSILLPVASASIRG